MAAVAGYSSIGGKDEAGAPAGALNGHAPSVKERLATIARGAGAAAANAKQAVSSMVAAPMPSVKLYTQPLNPAEQLTLRARVELVLNSCRDWREFADVRHYNVAPAPEVKLRVAHNVETFFYNYLVVCAGVLLLCGALQPLRGVQLAALVALAAVFYAVHPAAIAVPVGGGRQLLLGDTAKHVLLGVLAAVAVVFGRVYTLLLETLVFGAVFVFLHCLLRDHREPQAAAV